MPGDLKAEGGDLPAGDLRLPEPAQLEDAIAAGDARKAGAVGISLRRSGKDLRVVAAQTALKRLLFLLLAVALAVAVWTGGRMLSVALA